MNKIFKLSTEISEMPVLKQKKNLGGYGMSTISLSGVTVSAPGGGGGWPSFDFPSSDGGGPSSAGGGGGGGSIGGGNDQGQVDNIRDPSGALNSAKNEIGVLIMVKEAELEANFYSGKDIADAQEVIDAYQQTLDTIELLENSDNKYRIEVVSNLDNDSTLSSGEFTYDTATGEFVIKVEGSTGVHLPTFAHELEHANQLENGELYLENGDIAGYDINDEVDAYEIQHKISVQVKFDTKDLNGNNVVGPYEVTPDEIYNQFPGLYDHFKDKDNDHGGDSESSSYGSHR